MNKKAMAEELLGVLAGANHLSQGEFDRYAEGKMQKNEEGRIFKHLKNCRTCSSRASARDKAEMLKDVNMSEEEKAKCR